MTDLTDLNVVASAEDWAGFGADGCRSDRSIETGALPPDHQARGGESPAAPRFPRGAGPTSDN